MRMKDRYDLCVSQPKGKIERFHAMLKARLNPVDFGECRGVMLGAGRAVWQRTLLDRIKVGHSC